MKKILMLNYEFPPLGGGAGNATHNISRELVKLGYDVSVLTSGCRGDKADEIKDGVRIYRVISWRKGIHDCGLRGALTYLIFASMKLFSLRIKERYDLLHYFFSIPTGLLSFLPWSFLKVPYIVSLRGSDVPHYDKHNRVVHILGLILQSINRRIWTNASRVIALSSSLRQTALRTSPDRKIEVISNAIEADHFKPDGGASASSDTFKLITVSRLINRKGIDHILRALSGIDDGNIRLLIVGTGNYKQALEKLCSDLGLNGRVEFHGSCPRLELTRLYNGADLFILPSLAESFGMVFAEAMACGLPVIGTRTGGIVDLITHQEGGLLVEPANVEEIQEAIILMKNSPELRLEMGRKNREKILRDYCWDNIASQYADVYKQII